MNILALDLGTQTGWALYENGRIESGSESFAPGARESPGMRWIKFRRWFETITQSKPDLVVYERWNFVPGGGAGAEITGGFSTRVVEFCTDRDIDYTSMVSSEIKRFATGKGNASKKEMVTAVEHKWRKVADDNEADAVALLFLAISRYGGNDERRSSPSTV